MAVCAWCDLEMTTARSCVVEALHVDGREFRLGRYGSERGWANSGSGRCGDCGVRRGGLHHPGCDLQRCPRCRGQLLSCGCRFDEDRFDSGPDGLQDDALWDERLEPFGVDANGNPLERGVIGGVEVIVHREDIPASDITMVRGIRCTTAVRTVIDVAASVEPDAIREMVEDAVERGLFTEAELWERLAQTDMDAHVGAKAVRRCLGGTH
jgi:hypothetical protein